MSESPFGGQVPQPFYIKLSSGEIIGINDLYKREQNNAEASMSVSALKPQDLMAMQYQDENSQNRSFLFEIKDAAWNDIGVCNSFAPQPRVSGFLEGDELPGEVKGKEVYFQGSGWGGSSRSPGVLATGRSPYFFVPGEGEINMPTLNYFEVFRRGDDGYLRSLEPQQLDSEARAESQKHGERLAKADELMALFGLNFDFKDTSRWIRRFKDVSDTENMSPSDVTHYEDNRYIAQYEGSAGMGNDLIIFDKQTYQWVELKYFNGMGNDIFQIATADLGNKRKTRIGYLKGGLVTEPAVLDAGLITHTTSERYGISAINISPSDKQARLMGVPNPREPERMFVPNIQIWDTGEVKIPDVYPFSVIEEANPGTINRLLEAIKTTYKDGRINVKIKDANIDIPDPDKMTDDIIKNVELIQSRKHKASKGISGLLRNRLR